MAAELDPAMRDRLLDALAAGATKAEAARLSGYSRTHVHRLLADKRFLDDLERRRAGGGAPAGAVAPPPANEKDALAAADEKLALETLRRHAIGKVEVVDEHGKPSVEEVAPSVQVRAAEVLLKHVTAERRVVKPGPGAGVPTSPNVIQMNPDLGAAEQWLEKQA